MTPRAQQIGRPRTLCSPEVIIKKSDLDERTRYRDGGTVDIIETILAMDADSIRWIDTAGVECLRGYTDEQTLRNVWAFVKHNNRYRVDRTGHERVKSPGALFTSGTGDCKSYSIAAGALLRALGVPYKYRFTSYDAGDFSHVYLVARTRSGWLPLDAVHKKPLDEVPYRRKMDKTPAALGRIAPQWWPRQIETTQPTPTRRINWQNIGLWAFIIYLISR